MSSTAKRALVGALAVVAFGAAFAVGKATGGDGDETASAASAEGVSLSGREADVPTLKAAGPVPALRKAPQQSSGSGSSTTTTTGSSTTASSTTSSTTTSGSSTSGTSTTSPSTTSPSTGDSGTTGPTSTTTTTG